MSRDEPMLTLAEVCEMQPGDKDNPAWINPGFCATVATITKKPTKTGSMWVCELTDPDSGAQAKMAVFTAPKFSAGALIEVSGQGMRRDEFRGKCQVKVSQKTEIHTINAALARETGVASKNPLPQRQAPAPSAEPEPQENAAPASARPIYGATVGAGINQAMEVFRYIYPPATLAEMIKTPHFWAALHELASDFCRVAIILEAGKVAPAIKARVPADFDEAPRSAATKTPTAAPERPSGSAMGGRSDPPKPATKPQPGPGGSAYTPADQDLDPPF